MYKEIALFAENIGAEVIKDAPMKKYTSFKCGGNASVLIIPDSVDNLNKIIDFFIDNTVFLLYYIIRN